LPEDYQSDIAWSIRFKYVWKPELKSQYVDNLHDEDNLLCLDKLERKIEASLSSQSIDECICDLKKCVK
jgi:hypothetical protein